MLQTDLLRAQESGSKDLLIALHGLGDSMDGYRWLPQMLGYPKLNVMLVNAPDAYYGGFSWYDYAADAAPGVERSYRALSMLLDDCRDKGFSPHRTLLFGFSQGCLMTIETALRYSHKLAGCIGLSGYVHDPARLLQWMSPAGREQKFLITHGTRDPLLPIEKVREQIEQLRAAGVDIEWVEYDKEHTIIEEEIERMRRFVGERLGFDTARPAQ